MEDKDKPQPTLQSEEAKVIINFLNRTEIKGAEAETLTHVKAKLVKFITEANDGS